MRERNQFFKHFPASVKISLFKRISSSQYINKCNDALVIPKSPTCQNAH